MLTNATHITNLPIASYLLSQLPSGDLTIWSEKQKEMLLSNLLLHFDRGRKQQYEEALSAATQQYSEVVEEDSNHAEAINNWGAALHSLAETRSRPEALALLQEASAKFEQACALAPADFEAANNHADALAAWAALLSYDDAGVLVCGPESEDIWTRAYDRFAASMPSMTYDYDRVNCLCNWSTALSKHAEFKQELGDRQAAYSLFCAAAEQLTQSCQKSHSDPDGFVALVSFSSSHATLRHTAPHCNATLQRAAPH